MTTTPNGDSLRVPTPADLRRLSENPYSRTEAEQLPPIFSAIIERGKLPTAATVKLVPAKGRSPEGLRKSVERALDAAEKRGHLEIEWGDTECFYRIGAKYSSIPVAEPNGTKNGQAPKRTPLATYYSGNFRPQLRPTGPTGKDDYVYVLNSAINHAERFNPGICIEDVNREWIRAFDMHMKEIGISDLSRKIKRNAIRRIVRSYDPYRSVGPIPGSGRWVVAAGGWPDFEAIFRKERRGYLGNYFVVAFEPTTKASEVVQRMRRASVMQFIVWSGEPVRLDSVDDALLDAFRGFLVCTAGVSHRTALQRCSTIRQVVNHWQPGRLKKLHQHRPCAASAGTVQYFVDHEFIPAERKRGAGRKAINRIERTIRDLHQFCGRRDLRFEEFNAELCQKFLEWCLTNRGGRKAYAGETVNKTVRFALVGISIAATRAGLMKRRLFLERVGSYVRRPTKPRERHAANGHTTTNRHATNRHAANGHANNGDTAAGKIADPPAAPAAIGRSPGRPSDWEDVVDFYNKEQLKNNRLTYKAALAAYCDAHPDWEPPGDWMGLKDAVKYRRRRAK